MAAADTFHEVTIRGLTFKGIMSADGPYITCHRGRNQVGGVALGDCCELMETSRGYVICKYDPGQPRIPLDGFGEQDAVELVRQFGISTRYISGKSIDFSRSEAWKGLVDWSRRHPRIADRYAHRDSYLPRWRDRARAAPRPSETAATTTVAAPRGKWPRPRAAGGPEMEEVPFSFAAIGRIGGRELVYRARATIRIPVLDGTVAAEGVFMGRDKTPRSKTLVRAKGGDLYRKLGGRDHDAIVSYDLATFKAILDWQEQPPRGPQDHPLQAYDAIRLGHGLNDLTFSGIFCPPNWRTVHGDRHWQFSSIYGGTHGTGRTPLNAASLGWHREGSAQSMPLSIDELRGMGHDVIPDPDEGRVMQAVQSTIDEGVAIMDDQVVLQTMEPSYRVSTSATAGAKVFFDAFHHDYDFPEREDSDAIVLRFPLDEREEAERAALALAQALKSEVRMRGVVEYLDPRQPNESQITTNFRGIVGRYASMMRKAALDLPADAMRLQPDFAEAMRNGDAWVSAWSRIDDAIGGRLVVRQSDAPATRRFVALHEAFRHGILEGGDRPPKAERQPRWDPKENGAALAEAAWELLPTAGREFHDCWCQLLEEIQGGTGDTTLAEIDLLRCDPAAYPSKPAERRWADVVEKHRRTMHQHGFFR